MFLDCPQKNLARDAFLCRMKEGEHVFFLLGPAAGDLRRLTELRKQSKEYALPGKVFSSDYKRGVNAYCVRNIPHKFRGIVDNRSGLAATVAKQLHSEGERVTAADLDLMATVRGDSPSSLKNQVIEFIRSGFLKVPHDSRGAMLGVTVYVRNDQQNCDRKRAAIVEEFVNKGFNEQRVTVEMIGFEAYVNHSGKKYVRNLYKNRHSPLVRLIFSIRNSSSIKGGKKGGSK